MRQHTSDDKSNKRQLLVYKVVHLRTDKFAILRSRRIGDQWSESKFHLGQSSQSLAWLDARVFLEQSRER
jgi:hypothetical protein